MFVDLVSNFARAPDAKLSFEQELSDAFRMHTKGAHIAHVALNVNMPKC